MFFVQHIKRAWQQLKAAREQKQRYDRILKTLIVDWSNETTFIEEWRQCGPYLLARVSIGPWTKRRHGIWVVDLDLEAVIDFWVSENIEAWFPTLTDGVTLHLQIMQSKYQYWESMKFLMFTPGSGEGLVDDFGAERSFFAALS